MTVEHHPERKRFLIRLAPDAEAYIDYERREDGVLDLQHTVVPVAWRRRGIGGTLVEQTLQMVRKEGLRVIPSCPFISTWLDGHPQFRDLVAST